MTNNLYTYFNNSGAIFMGARIHSKKSEIGIFGVAYDGTTSFRPGARFGPAAIREVSNSIETYCPQLDQDLENIEFIDLGALDIPYGAPEPVIEKVRQATESLIKEELKPLIFGGEHSITAGAISAIASKYEDLVLVQLDAHADLRDSWLGSRHSHACAMRRCLEVLPSGNLFQIGIRSGTKEEFLELNEQKRLIKYGKNERPEILSKSLEPIKGKPVYLTVDLDWFDPSIVPGTGTPEPGGYFWDDFAAIIEILKDHNLIAADIVELSPQLDLSGVSSVVAAKIARSLLMIMSS